MSCKLVAVYFEEETSSLPNAALTNINAPIAMLLLRLHARSFEDWHLNFPKLTKATSLPVWWPPLLSDDACPRTRRFRPPWSVETLALSTL
jgi:hypothetical protein